MRSRLERRQEHEEGTGHGRESWDEERPQRAGEADEEVETRACGTGGDGG